ncbi:hypothetical protein BTH_II0820 [Burkholderia thailandensis E264]|nr:hypothetical protein BTH_II0820 [Burkholderia thailandensis E264]
MLGGGASANAQARRAKRPAFVWRTKDFHEAAAHASRVT